MASPAAPGLGTHAGLDPPLPFSSGVHCSSCQSATAPWLAPWSFADEQPRWSRERRTLIGRGACRR